MHTAPPFILRPAASPARPVPGPVGRLLLILGLLCTVPTSAAAQSFPGTPDGQRAVNYRVYPTDVWGPRAGPGVGLGMVVHNLARRHDHWLLTAAPAQHEQAATLSFASANPRTARRAVLVDARGLHSDRDWYGPPDRRLTLERRSYRARVRIGQTALDRRLLVQPHVSLEGHRVDGRAGPASGRPVSGVGGGVPAASASFQGVRGGLDVQYRTGAPSGRASSAFEVGAGWERYTALDDTDLRFDRVDVRAGGVLRLHGVHRLVARVEGTTTRPRTAAGVPLFLLPRLGGALAPGWARGRFVDRDRLVGHLLYRFPLWSVGEVVALEGHAGGHVAGTYRDVGEQFTTDVAFDEPDPTSPGRPLRPSVSLGLRLAAPIRPGVSMDLALGLSPEGLSAVTVSFRQRLQALRAAHHSATPFR